ncbi:MAG: SRPBCC domain-containing protein [Bryobacterales bacterium]|nr:SRPBCC domain-containing protein [Bryobacterales bacterium]
MEYTGESEIRNTRVFDAPRSAVYSAFRSPETLARWWGPAGFTNTIQELDLRPGGKWRLNMHGPGGDYDNESVFEEVVENERVVFRHLGPVHPFVMTMTFEDAEPGATRLSWRMVHQTRIESELSAFFSNANEQNFDRLETELRGDC